VRVAYVCADPGVPVFGTKGASVHVQAIAGALLRRGAEVTLLATRTGGMVPAALAHAEVVALPALPKGDAAARERAAQAANAGLAAALRALGPVDLVVERYSLWSHAALEHARAAGVPAVLEVNAPLVDEQGRHRALHDRPAAERVARRAFAAATAIVAVSEPVADWVAARCADGRRRVHVVGNGVDPDRFPPVERPPGRCTVGFVGTLKPWHGVEVLVDAFDRLHARRPGVRLLVVGDGPQSPWLRADLARRPCAPAVEFTGSVDPAAVPAALARMDVAVAPYPPLEPFYFSPLKVVEAMASGLPVVCSRIGALPDLVRDGVTGVLCRPGDPFDLAAALELLAADPPLRRRLGEEGRARVLASHTWDQVAGEVLRLAEEGAPAGAEAAA